MEEEEKAKAEADRKKQAQEEMGIRNPEAKVGADTFCWADYVLPFCCTPVEPLLCCSGMTLYISTSQHPQLQLSKLCNVVRQVVQQSLGRGSDCNDGSNRCRQVHKLSGAAGTSTRF